MPKQSLSKELSTSSHSTLRENCATVRLGSAEESSMGPLKPFGCDSATGSVTATSVKSQTAPNSSCSDVVLTSAQVAYMHKLEKLVMIDVVGPALARDRLSVDSDEDFQKSALEIGTNRFAKERPSDYEPRNYQYHSIKGVLIYITKHICESDPKFDWIDYWQFIVGLEPLQTALLSSSGMTAEQLPGYMIKICEVIDGNHGTKVIIDRKLDRDANVQFPIEDFGIDTQQRVFLRTIFAFFFIDFDKFTGVELLTLEDSNYVYI